MRHAMWGLGGDVCRSQSAGGEQALPLVVTAESPIRIWLEISFGRGVGKFPNSVAPIGYKSGSAVLPACTSVFTFSPTCGPLKFYTPAWISWVARIPYTRMSFWHMGAESPHFGRKYGTHGTKRTVTVRFGSARRETHGGAGATVRSAVRSAVRSCATRTHGSDRNWQCAGAGGRGACLSLWANC